MTLSMGTRRKGLLASWRASFRAFHHGSNPVSASKAVWMTLCRDAPDNHGADVAHQQSCTCCFMERAAPQNIPYLCCAGEWCRRSGGAAGSRRGERGGCRELLIDSHTRPPMRTLHASCGHANANTPRQREFCMPTRTLHANANTARQQHANANQSSLPL